MRELNEELGDAVELEIISARSERGQAAAVKYDLGGPRHGLVAFGPDGKLGFKLPGHFYTKEDIELELEEIFGIGG